MDPGPTISRPYTRHKWVGRIICSQAVESAPAQDPLRLPESMTIIKNRTDNVRFSFPLLNNAERIISLSSSVMLDLDLLFLHICSPSIPFLPSQGSPSKGAHNMGELYVDNQGVLYFCMAGGTPGSWKKVQLV